MRSNTLLLTFILRTTFPLYWTILLIVTFRTVLHAITYMFSIHAVPESVADEMLLRLAHVLVLFTEHLAIVFVFTICAVADAVAEPCFLKNVKNVI